MRDNPNSKYSLPLVLGARFHNKKFQDGRVPFKKNFGTKGLSYSFNPEDFWSTYQGHPTISTYNEEMILQDQPDSGVMSAKNSGPLNGLEVLPAKEGNGQEAVIHSPYEVPDILQDPMRLVQGNAYKIGVQMLLDKVDGSIRRMSIEDRGCMLAEDEHNLTLFREYSFSSCMFECHWRQALEKCGCFSSQYPPPIGDLQNLPFCHMGNGELCFLKTVQSGDLAPKDCGCMDDCESIKAMVSPSILRTH